MKQGLLVMDLQRGVFSLQRPVYQADALLRNVQQTLRFARERGLPVIFSLHGNDTFLQEGTPGHSLLDGLAVRPADILVRKSKPDVFADTELDAVVRNLELTSLLVTGVISNGCVRQACLSALERHYEVTLIKDAHSTFYANAETVIRRVNREMETAGARIVSADELK